MGTNYYLVANEDDTQEFIDNCEHMHIGDSKIHKAACLHIGKSSYGWAFHFMGYRSLGIESLDNYIKLMNNTSRVIVDEYSEVIDAGWLIEMIRTDKAPKHLYNGIDENRDYIDYVLETDTQRGFWQSVESLRQSSWHDKYGYSFSTTQFS